MGPLVVSASHIVYRMHGNSRPNCIDSGAISLSVVSLTLGLPLSCCDNRIRMIHGWRCAWGTAAMQDILSLSPNIRTASATGRRMLKRSFTLRCISPWMKPTIYRVHADAWGPFPNVTLNWDNGAFFLECMNRIKVTKPVWRQWNRLLDKVVTIIKYNKSTSYHDIYIKVLPDGTVSYHTVSTDDVLNTTNNETSFTELKRVFEENFDMKVQ